MHAKGSGAYGVFRVTNDVSQYTCADVFQPGRETPMLARFSTMAGEMGSPDSWRDPRGFALKFYTREGNYDMVGNNPRRGRPPLLGHRLRGALARGEVLDRDRQRDRLPHLPGPQRRLTGDVRNRPGTREAGPGFANE